MYIQYPEIKPVETIFENIGLVKRLVPKEAVYISKQLKIRELTPVQFSFAPGFGSNSLLKGLRTNCFSLNVFAGYSKGLCGLEIGGANIIQEDVVGVQFAGLTNIVNGSTLGVEFGGILNYNFDYLNGVQIGGIGNIVLNKTSGAQFGGIFNYTKADVTGLQVGGITNINLSSVNGVLIGGVSNSTKNNITGLQLGGIYNFASSVRGVQLSGIINISSGNVSGIQLSAIVNKAKKLNGVQFGLVNIADSVETGLQFGLFNIVKNGYQAFEFTSNETYIFDFLYKTGGKKLYSILNTGIDENQVGAGYGIGLIQPIFARLSVSIDGISTAMLFTDTRDVYQGQKTSVRLALNYDLLKHLGVTTGLSFNFFDPHNAYEKSTVSNGPPFKGSSNKLISQSIETNQKAAWIGWFIGVRL